MASNVGSATQDCPLKKKKEPPEIQDPSKYWINFTFQDNSGQPIKDVTIRIVLPDGKVEEHTSDGRGMIEIKNIEPGICKIESDWKKVMVYETVLIQ